MKRFRWILRRTWCFIADHQWRYMGWDTGEFDDDDVALYGYPESDTWAECKRCGKKVGL